jgi:hypothetical protein
MEEIKERKLLSALCHCSIYLLWLISIIFSIIILNTSEDTIVKKNAKEVINFSITTFLYCFFNYIILIFVPFIGGGSLMFILPMLLSIISFFILILPIFAIIKVLKNPNQPFRYPCIIRFIR